MRLLRVHNQILCGVVSLLIGVLLNGTLSGYGVQALSQSGYVDGVDTGQQPPLKSDGHGHRLAIPLLGTELAPYNEQVRVRSIDSAPSMASRTTDIRRVSTDSRQPLLARRGATATPTSRTHLFCVYRL